MNELTREQQLRIKAQEVIDLLKEYLPEYKEAFDLYDPDNEYNLDICKEGDEAIMGEFSFILWDKGENYCLDIRNICILGVLKPHPTEMIEIARYIDEEKIKTCTIENPWTWDDAIEVIKKRLEETQNEAI